MKKIFAIIFGFICLFVNADVLMWQVDDTATIDGTPIQNWIMASPYVEDDDHWVAARVKLTDANGTVLGIYFDGAVEDGTWGVWIGDNGGGSWGAGVPTGNQSPTGHKTWYTTTDNPITTVLEDPAAIEALFYIEIGYNSWNEDVGDYVWETLAESLPKETYETLRNQYMYGEGTLGPHKNDIWTPTEFYTQIPVPEPSSSALSLIGVSLFLLMRPRGKI